MPVKFKIGFKIDAETLFSIVAKFLPLDELSVEEVIERPHAPAQPKLANYPKPTKLAKPRKYAKAAIPIRLDVGINAIILKALDDGGEYSPIEIKQAIAAGGYSPNSIGSRMAQLIRDGHVKQENYGLYKLGKTP